ncbi:MAG: hypothetical protein Q9N68_08880 [Gammaproteobacteria bacterium]|nr:hypothetical protein [Gammaproteobacteria bacterium]
MSVSFSAVSDAITILHQPIPPHQVPSWRSQQANIIQHPNNVSLHCQRLDRTARNPQAIQLCDSPQLCFNHSTALQNNTRLELMINIQDKTHCFQVVVINSQAQHDGFHIQVGFESYNEAFRLRMIEQICHIETYREDVYQQQGRQLCYEGAAQEWIEHYASTFPTLNGINRE